MTKSPRSIAPAKGRLMVRYIGQNTMSGLDAKTNGWPRMNDISGLNGKWAYVEGAVFDFVDKELARQVAEIDR